MARRPGWSALQAVRDHRATPLDPDVASRWGPRIVELLARVVEVGDTFPATKAAFIESCSGAATPSATLDRLGAEASGTPLS